jgi:acyl-CoA thioesterase I
MRPARLILPCFFLVLLSVVRLSAQIVAFGASNVSGAGVETSQAWPAQLEALLQAKGYHVHVINAGITGDTTTNMLKRLDSSIPSGTKIVILDLSGGLFNDFKENIPREKGIADLREIAARLHKRGIKIIRETTNQLPEKLKQADKIHLNPAGHEELAKQLLPSVIQDLTAN